MLPYLKDKWLRALRSGEYKQGTGFLRTFGNQYCCLGVLADINGEKWNTPGKKTGREEYFITDKQDKTFPEKFGALGPSYDKHIEQHKRNQLMMMNDRFYTFEQIADWIEENV